MPKSKHRHAQGERRDRGGARAFWSGTLSFGLVSIPVELYPGTRAGGAPLRMLAPDGTPLARRFYCPKDDAPLDAEQLVRGYEWQKGEYVVVTDEELEALEPKKSREIDLQRFVAVSAIDPIYYDRSYFLAPAGGSSKAYFLLTSILERSQRAGIGSFVLRDHEYWVAILPDNGLLRAQTLRLAEEVRSFEGIGLPKHARAPRALVQAFESALDHGKHAFDPDALRDEHTEQLVKLVHTKEHAKRDLVESEVTEGGSEAENDAEIIDLMAALKRSVGEHAQKSPGRPARKAR